MELLDIVIENPRGLHMRVATEIVKIAREHGAEVRVARKGGRIASGNSVLELLLLDAPQGTPLHVEVEGRDARVVAEQIGELFTDGSGI